MESPLAPLPKSEWSRRKAKHLLNRAGLGHTPKTLNTFSDLSPSEAVDRLVDFEEQATSFSEPDNLPPRWSFGEYRTKLKEEEDLSKEQRENKVNEYKNKHKNAIRNLKAWWLKRFHQTNRPLQEKLALFWHGHFATEASVVKNARWNYQLYKVFRTHAAGNVQKLAFEVARSPMMLKYLDNDTNRFQHPNENWARELLELHTLGLGEYTEEDVMEAARAFTGWTIEDGKFSFYEKWHDNGPKVFLGERGRFDGAEVLKIIFQQRPTAGFLALKTWKYFVREEPEPKLIRKLAETLWNHDYEMKPMLRQLFRSRYFYSDQVMGEKVKNPVQLIVSLLNLLEVQPNDNGYQFLAGMSKHLGQDLFDPPNVSGWDRNSAWINTGTLRYRYNMPEQVLQKSKLGTFDATDFFDSLPAKSVAETVEQLEHRFLVPSLDRKQKQLLKNTLAPNASGTDSLDPEQHSNDRLQDTLVLLLSSPEFQVC